MKPLSDVREISRIGYGFIGSKVLFAALDFDIFGHLSAADKPLDTLVADTGIDARALEILLTACVSLGLLARDAQGNYLNAPASQSYLVRGSRQYYGDYYRFQISRQVYPILDDLNDALAGKPVTPFYELVNDSAEEVSHFIHAQHSGSLGPAYLLSRRIDFSDSRALLDVAGGSGAFSIVLCQQNVQLKATILDFPKVIDSAVRYVDEAALQSRISYVAGDANVTEWPDQQDDVLMSYLLSAVPVENTQQLLAKAYDSLKPGGRLLIHDFVVDDDRSGPITSALFFVPGIMTPGANVLTPVKLTSLTAAAGFSNIEIQELIPEITRLLVAQKPLS